MKKYIVKVADTISRVELEKIITKTLEEHNNYNINTVKFNTSVTNNIVTYHVLLILERNGE